MTHNKCKLYSYPYQNKINYCSNTLSSFLMHECTIRTINKLYLKKLNYSKRIFNESQLQTKKFLINENQRNYSIQSNFNEIITKNPQLIQLIFEYLKNNSITYPNHLERLHIMNQFKLSLDELNEILSYLREKQRYDSDMDKRINIPNKYLNKNTKKRIHPQALSIIHEWIQSKKNIKNQNTNEILPKDTKSEQNEESSIAIQSEHVEINIKEIPFPSPFELHHLSIKTGLSKKKIQKLMYRLLDLRSEITEEKKSIITSFLYEIGYRKLTFDEYNLLSEKTGLGRFQLYAIIERSLDKLGSVSNEARKFIEDWIANKSNNYLISKEDLIYLAEKTRLAKRQVRYIINNLKDPNRPIKKEDRIWIKNWLIENSDNNKSISEIVNEIKKKISLSEKQIRWIIYSLKESKVTIRKRRIIIQFMNSVGRKFTTEDIYRLSNELSLSPRQVRILLNRYTKKINTITMESRKKIHEWLKSNPNYNFQIFYNSEELKKLQEETKLNKDQIISMIRRLNESKIKISTHQWIELKNWIQNQKPSIKEIIECGIIPSEINDQLKEFCLNLNLPLNVAFFTIKNINNPPGIITEDNRNFIKNYISNSSSLSKNEIDNLQSLTNLTRKQVLTLIYNFNKSKLKNNNFIIQLLNNNKFITSDEIEESIIEELSELSGMPLSNVRSIIYKYFHQKQSKSINEMKSDIIKIYKEQSSQENDSIINYIQNKLGYDPTFIRNCIREYRYKENSIPITSEIKQLINDWLKKNDYRKPSKIEFAELLHQTEISNRQLHNQIRYQIQKNISKLTA